MTTPRRLVVKIGGAQLEQPTARAEIANALAAAAARGHELIVVHGGGNQIRDLTKRLGLVDRYHDGLRITDAATADVVLMVLGGFVNRLLVHDLQRAGLRAAGLCGADGDTFRVAKHAPGGVDLGYVGIVERIDARLVETLLGSGVTPVLGTVAPLVDDTPNAAAGDRAHFYNVNADLAAGPLCAALHGDALLFLTDVKGVLDADKQRIPSLDAKSCAALRASGVIAGGMIPKVDAALAAIEAAPSALVKIAPAAGTDAVSAALRDDVGTRFLPATDRT